MIDKFIVQTPQRQDLLEYVESFCLELRILSFLEQHMIVDDISRTNS